MSKICMVTSIHPDFDARIFKMAKYLAAEGHDISLVCPWKVEEGLKDGINFYPFQGGGSRIRRYKNLRTIWRKLQNLECEIYHFHDLDLLPLFILFKISLGRNKYVVYDMHENYPEEMWHKPYLPKALKPFVVLTVKLTEWLGINIVRNLVVVEDNQEITHSNKHIRTVKIRNFASRDLANGRQDNYLERSNTVIFTGSQYESNGSLLFLEIAKIVHAQEPEIKFQCIERFGSDFKFREEMLRRIEQYGLKETVTFLPNIPPYKIMDYLNAATIALVPVLDIPRHRKAIPNKIFEYMAAGLPIVASDLPYNKLFIEQSASGFIANPASPEDFAYKIIQLSNNKASALKMGLKGIQAFESLYNWENESKKLTSFYMELY